MSPTERPDQTPEPCAIAVPSGDTIAALVTSPGRAALATIRVHGPGALHAVAHVIGCDPNHLLRKTQGGRLWIGPWGGRHGERVVLHVISEHDVDINSHGGPIPVELILHDLSRLGVRAARWQEVNQRISRSVIEAEAIAALAQASTLRTSAVLLDQWRGALRHSVEFLLGRLAEHSLGEFLECLERMTARSELGLRLVPGWKIAIVGRPNVGKSSLLNELVGYERAIVHESAGTTRDVLTALTSVDGWPVEFSDSAGIRTVGDVIEAEGVERARTAITKSDWQLVVLDGSHLLLDEDLALLRLCQRPIVVVNKIDLPRAWTDCEPFREPYFVSAKEKRGIAGLVQGLGNIIVPGPPRAGEAVPFTARQIQLLRLAGEEARQGRFERAAKALHDLTSGSL